MNIKFELSFGEFMQTVGRNDLLSKNAWKALYNHLLDTVKDDDVVSGNTLIMGQYEVNTKTLIKIYSVKHSEITEFNWDDIKLAYLLSHEDGIIVVENDGEQPDTWLVPVRLFF